MNDAPIREPLRSDAKNVRELCRIAHPKLSEDVVLKVGSIARTQQPDTTTVTWTRTQDGAQITDVPFLHTVRVIAPRDQQARAFIYCAPPMDWIIAQGRDIGLAIGDRVTLAGSLTECQLLATGPRWRGRGYATRLLADAEDRYRAAGYRAIFAVIENSNEEALTWYRKRGFTVGDLHSWPMIQLWKNRMHYPARYNHLDNGQLIGFKALHDGVSVTALGGTVHVRGLMKEGAITLDE